jgi:hypothetical protein
MIYFGRGVYKINFEGCELELRPVAAGQIDAYCGGDYVGTGTSKRHAANILNKSLGLTTGNASSTPAKKPLIPCVVHNRQKGAYVFGLQELCQGLREGIANYGLPGSVEPHTTRRGKACHAISSEAMHDFWARCHDDIPGQEIKIIGLPGKEPFTTVIGQ